MSRDDRLQRVQSLSDDDLRRLVPFIESHLAFLSEPDGRFDVLALAEGIRAAQESARTEPLERNADLRYAFAASWRFQCDDRSESPSRWSVPGGQRTSRGHGRCVRGASDTSSGGSK